MRLRRTSDGLRDWRAARLNNYLFEAPRDQCGQRPTKTENEATLEANFAPPSMLLA